MLVEIIGILMMIVLACVGGVALQQIDVYVKSYLACAAWVAVIVLVEVMLFIAIAYLIDWINEKSPPSSRK